MDLSYVTEFEDFVKKEVKEATEELDSLEERSRKHLQKLVFTNLVDRFDVMIDKTIIHNALHENLLDDALNKLDSPATEADVLKLLMNGNDINSIVKARVQSVLRNGVLRNRHSSKLEKLFQVVEEQSNYKNKPRVNVNTGKILASFTLQNKKVPASICGYADWIYSRRNSIVHGGGSSKMSEIDIKQLKKLHKVDVAKTTRLKLKAIQVTSVFYLDVVALIKEAG